MVKRGALYRVAESKLNKLKRTNEKLVEIIRITPEYYSSQKTPLAVRIFIALILMLFIAIVSSFLVFLINNDEAPMIFKIVGISLMGSGILFLIGIGFLIFSDIIIYPNMLQALLLDKDILIKWNCVFGLSWAKSFDLRNLDFFVKNVLLDVDEHGMDRDFVIDLHYRKDEYGKEITERLWRENPINRNVIDKIAESLKEVGFEVKEPMTSKFFGTLASFDR